MGNYMSCHSIEEVNCRAGRGRVVLPGGAVHEFDQPVTVAELMLEHHRHYVVEYRPAGECKLRPLPADRQLDIGKLYVMVPNSDAISAEAARRMVLLSTNKGRGFSSFAARLVGGANDKGIGESVAVSWPTTERLEKVGEVEWSVEGFGERLSREYSIKGWKPSLGTIEERILERKVSHWLF